MGMGSRSSNPSRAWVNMGLCTGMIAASATYVYRTATAHLDELSTISLPDKEMHNTNDMSIADLDVPISFWRQLVYYTQWLLSPLLVLTWMCAILLSRKYRLHAPIRRLTQRAFHVMTRNFPMKWSSEIHALSQKSSAGSLLARVQSNSELDIDELDLLVITSLTSDRKLPASKSSPDLSSVHSSSSSNTSVSSSPIQSEPRLERNTKILLHPREGAKGGRHSDNHIVLNDAYVSRHHFQIQYDPLEKEYFLRDLGSTTGTYVFIPPDAPKRLDIGDYVKLGDTEFQVASIDENLATGNPFLRLVFTEGPLVGVAQTIGKTAVTLGRHSGNALCIPDDGSISARHAVLSFLGDGFYITDLTSTNGTAFRLSSTGQRSGRRYLMHGDVFGVGNNRFLIEYSHQLALQDKRDAWP